MDHLVHDLSPDQRPYTETLESKDYCRKAVADGIRQNVGDHQFLETQVAAQQVGRNTSDSINDEYYR